MVKRRNEIKKNKKIVEFKKNKKIVEFKKELNLNEDKFKGVTAQTNAEIDMLEFQRQDSELRADEMELVLRLGLKVINPVMKYEQHKEWEAHAERATKWKLGVEKKKLANFEQAIESKKKYLESQANLEETRKKVIVAELKKLGLDEKDIFKKKVPSYIG